MKHLKVAFFLFFAVAPVFKSNAQSVTDSVRIQEITVLGKRIFKKEEAGQKQTHVDSMVLMDKITVSLSDVLSENTTVYIKDHGRGAMATASFRGTAPSHTQVFWNGININSPMLGMVDFSLIPTSIIDDLSLKHGGASISEQSGGIGGSVDISNNADWDNRLTLQYVQGIGSYSTCDEQGQVAIGNHRFQGKTRLYDNASENDYTFVNKAITEKPTVKNTNAQYGKQGFEQEFYFRSNEKSLFTMKLWGQDAYRSIPTVMSYEGDSMSNLNEQKDRTLKAVADYSHYGNKMKWYARTGADFQQLDYQLTNEVSGVGTIPAIYSLSTMKSWYNHIKDEFTPNEKLSVHVSADYNRFDVDTKDTVGQTGYSVVRNDFSFFAGSYYNALTWLNLSLMLREDLIEDEATPVVFNLGAAVKPWTKRNIVWNASIARNYHHPSLNDLYWQPGGNPDLKPEEGINAESSFKQVWTNKNFKIEQELTGYYSDITNWILWLPSFKGYWQPFNVKKVKSYGAEYHIWASQKVGKFNFSINGNYAYTKSLNYGEASYWGDESIGKQLPYIPVHSANLLAAVEYKGFYLHYQNNSYSERYTMTSNQVGLSDDSEDLQVSSTGRMGWYYPYYMNNLSFGKELLWKEFKLGLDFKINNLFNEEYRSVLGRYMPLRNYELLIRVSYRKKEA